MKFDWEEYFNLAKELAGTPEEAKLRSAVSRAYYSAFCLSRNYLRDIEQDPRLSHNKTDIKVHKYVADEFIHHKSKSKTMIEIGKDLNRLRPRRNKADYEDIIFNLPKEAITALMLAENIISALRKLPQ